MKTSKIFSIIIIIFLFSFEGKSQSTNQNGLYQMNDTTIFNVDILSTSEVEYLGENITLKPIWQIRHGGKFQYNFSAREFPQYPTRIFGYENGEAKVYIDANIFFYDHSFPYVPLFEITTEHLTDNLYNIQLKTVSKNTPLTIRNAGTSPDKRYSQVSFNSNQTYGTVLSVYKGNVECTRYYNASDIRLKSNITDLSDRAVDLLTLQPKSYNKQSVESFLSNKSKSIETDNFEFGLMAQEVEETYPELVFEGEGNIKSINYSGFLPLIVEALKNQKQIVQENGEQITKIKEVNNSILDNSVKANATQSQVDFFINLPFNDTSVDFILYVHNINTGQMVWKYDSNGSSDQFKNKTVTWNLENLNGSKATSGFYTYTYKIKTDKLETNNGGKKFALK